MSISIKDLTRLDFSLTLLLHLAFRLQYNQCAFRMQYNHRHSVASIRETMRSTNMKQPYRARGWIPELAFSGQALDTDK